MSLNRLRGKRLQARSGSRWVKNTVESVFGLKAPACPACRGFNVIAAGSPAPLRCQRCDAPMLPACPEHGEATCDESCKSRPCANCAQVGPVPPFIDPKLWREERICRFCSRVIEWCAGCCYPLNPSERGQPVVAEGGKWHATCLENHREHSLTAAEIL